MAGIAGVAGKSKKKVTKYRDDAGNVTYEYEDGRRVSKEDFDRDEGDFMMKADEKTTSTLVKDAKTGVLSNKTVDQRGYRDSEINKGDLGAAARANARPTPTPTPEEKERKRKNQEAALKY